MPTITRTFPLTFSSTYQLGSVLELLHFRDTTFADDEQVAIYLEAIYGSFDLRSFAVQQLPTLDGSESDAERVSKFYAAQSKSQKLGLLILGRKANAGDWREKAEIVLTNVGRKQYLDLMPLYLSQNSVRILESNDALAIRLTDYGNGLLKVSDKIELEAVLRIEIEKKNNVDAILTRITALENLLGIMGAPTATIEGRNGLVPKALAGQGNRLLRGDGTWQSPTELTGLRTRTNATAVPFNANAFTLAQPTELRWIDGGVTNLNLPANAGTLLRNDPLFEAAKELYESQEFNNAGGRWWKRDENNGAWSAWKELAFLEGSQVFTGDKSFAGFTRLGDVAPAIKNKLLTSATATTQGGSMTIPHGLVGDKIIAVKVLVRQSPNAGVSGSLRNQLGYEYDWWYDSASVNITNISGSSAFILSKPISILLTYIA